MRRKTLSRSRWSNNTAELLCSALPRMTSRGTPFGPRARAKAEVGRPRISPLRVRVARPSSMALSSGPAGDGVGQGVVQDRVALEAVDRGDDPPRRLPDQPRRILALGEAQRQEVDLRLPLAMADLDQREEARRAGSPPAGPRRPAAGSRAAVPCPRTSAACGGRRGVPRARCGASPRPRAGIPIPLVRCETAMASSFFRVGRRNRAPRSHEPAERWLRPSGHRLTSMVARHARFPRAAPLIGNFGAGDAANHEERTGRRTMNSLPLPGPSLRASTVPPCISTRRLDQRQPDAQPPLRPVQRALALGEQVEDLGQEFRARCPTPVSRTRMATWSASPLGRQPDLPARFGVLGGVVQQVDRSPASSRVASASSQIGSSGSDTISSWLAPADSSARTVSIAPRTDRRQLHALLAQLDLAPGDPRDVQQVVDQAGQVVDLTLDHRAAIPRGRSPERSHAAPAPGRCLDRGQGVAQLVGEHRQELVLAAVGLLSASSIRLRSVMSMHAPVM